MHTQNLNSILNQNENNIYNYQKMSEKIELSPKNKKVSEKNNQSSIEDEAKLVQQCIRIITSKDKASHSCADEISQFFGMVKASERVFIIPIEKKNASCQNIYEPLQLYKLKENNTIVKHRKSKRRNLGQLNRTANQQSQRDRFLVKVDEQLLLNSAILIMTMNQKLCLTFGGKSDQLLTQQGSRYTKESSVEVKSLELMKQTKNFLEKRKKQIFDSKRGKNRGLKDGKKSIFENLKQINIEIEDQNLTFLEWTQSINIVYSILLFIAKEELTQLQTLIISINTGRGYNNRIQNEKNIQNLLKNLHLLLKNIFLSKLNLTIKDDKEGYYPSLINVCFNPTLFLQSLRQREQTAELNDQANSQHELQNARMQSEDENDIQLSEQQPIVKVTLLNLSNEINRGQNIKIFIKTIFSLFPKLSYLIIKMAGSVVFQKFNELTEDLHIFCPLLQSLHIFNNSQQIENQKGLRNILQFYPYLSNIKIKIWPKFKETNQVPNRNIRGRLQIQQQYKKQFELIQQIQFKRLYIQRMINLIKILQKKGYSRQECMQIIQFEKPIKFSSLF